MACYYCGRATCRVGCAGRRAEVRPVEEPREEPGPDAAIDAAKREAVLALEENMSRVAMRIADPVAAVERGQAAREALPMVRFDGVTMRITKVDRAAGEVTLDSAIKNDADYVFGSVDHGPAPRGLAAWVPDHLKRLYDQSMTDMVYSMNAATFGPPSPEEQARLDAWLKECRERPARPAPSLDAFTASVEEHLLPLLPGRFRVVGDKRSDQPYGFDGWVLDEHDREVIKFEAFGPLYDYTAEEIARDVAWELMRRQARGR